MITYKDAVTIGTAIMKGRNRSLELASAPENESRKIGVRCASYSALEELWYEVLSNKVKEQFDYEFKLFYNRCLYMSNQQFKTS